MLKAGPGSGPKLIDEADMELSWTQLPPGPELAIHLSLVEWEGLSDRELVAAMDAARRQATWAQGRQLEAVGELARRHHAADPFGGSDTHRRICGEVSLNLTIPTSDAEELVALAEVLPDRLPKTWAALRTGQIDYGRAAVMMTGVFGLSDETAHRIDDDLIDEAADTCRTRLRSRVKKMAKAADPEAFAERTKQAKTDRRVELWENDDDTCDLVGRNLSAADAHAIRNRLTAAATAMRADGDERTVGQIRADLYRDLLRGIPLPEAARRLITPDPADGAPNESAAPDVPVAQPPTTYGDQAACEHTATPADGTPCGDATSSRARPSPDDIIAVVETQIAQALAAAADEQLTMLLDRARADGRLDGLAQLVRQATQAICDAVADIADSWCRTTGGTPARHGHDGYVPPAAMRRLIQRRHTTCTFPTCNRRSVHCDLDHTIPYDKGGRTCKCNIAPLCRAHHRIIKQHPTWKLVQPWPGLLIWVAPSGTWHIVTPQ